MNTVTVLGSGAWGTAVATLLAANGCMVKLWCYDASVAHEIATHGTNQQYLPGVTLNSRIQAVTDLEQALDQSTYIFEAIPVKHLRSILEQARSYYRPDQVWVVLSKGIEQHTLMLPTQIIDDVFGKGNKPSRAVFSGPSFAMDLASHQVTAVTIAATDCLVGNQLQTLLANGYFRPYISLDIIGAQVGGALKNSITLGIGILDGAGYTDNAKAFLLTRGLHEIAQVAVSLGGKQETIYGLSGMGDLILSSMGKLSKNLALGRRLGSGTIISQIEEQSSILPEGINTIQSVHELITSKKLDLPICLGIYQMIFNGKSTHQFLAELMSRPLESDCTL
ncbi:MAG: NAD(P)-dependent glycerol-3-phosphate dehydrogenase [Candidatus Babeliales bacterium]|nr:NAD(P)-dependent glycerol-3-phosphate dehydrogenase [Candidatus Babeliales bacterium]